MSENLADRVRRMMQVRGLSGRELSRRAGLSSPGHINLLLREGGGARTETIAAVAKVLDVDFDWLARGVGEAQPREIPYIPDTRGFPRALVSAIGARDLYPGTLAALSEVCGRDVSEQDWRSYVDSLEAANRGLDNAELLRVRSSGRATVRADVVDTATRQMGSIVERSHAARTRELRRIKTR